MGLVVQCGLRTADGRQYGEQVGRLGGSGARASGLTGNYVRRPARNHDNAAVQAKIGVVRGKREFTNLRAVSLAEEHVGGQVDGLGQQRKIGAHQYVLRQPMRVVARSRGVDGNGLRLEVGERTEGCDGQRAGDQSLGEHLPNIANFTCLRYLRTNA